MSKGVENSGTWPSWPIRYVDRPDRDGDPAIEIDVRGRRWHNAGGPITTERKYNRDGQ